MKPTELPRWATNLADPSDIVDPLAGKKDIGWQDAEQPPHSYMNWLFNTIYLWAVWLDAFESTAHTWTAAQSFFASAFFQSVNPGEVAINIEQGQLWVNSADPDISVVVDATGSSTAAFPSAAGGRVTNLTGPNITAVFGNANSTGGWQAGLFGLAASPDPLSTNNRGLESTGVWGEGAPGTGGFGPAGVGVFGHGGLGNGAGSIGGLGLFGMGGDASNATAIPGAGLFVMGGAALTNGSGSASAFGGSIFGPSVNYSGIGSDTNATGVAGGGLLLIGGDVFGDTHGRVGGIGLEVRGGHGQAGYGTAIQVDHGDVNLFSGVNLNVGGSSVFTGGVTINNALTVSGLFRGANISLTGNAQVTGAVVAHAGGESGGDWSVFGILSAEGPLVADGGITATTLSVSGATAFATPALTAMTLNPGGGAWASKVGSGALNMTPSYWKDGYGVTHCQGTAITGSSSNPIAQLPAGFRPLRTTEFTIQVGGTAGTVTVETDGTITSSLSGSTTGVTLSGIHFRTN